MRPARQRMVPVVLSSHVDRSAPGEKLMRAAGAGVPAERPRADLRPGRHAAVGEPAGPVSAQPSGERLRAP
ncbi:hypothetical protein GCM10010368_54470 [Streptomyces roseiscleroticus]|uniref:Uncharacterized protein n=1 Tax=Streptomyces roseiscleroticus TaxID=1972 RepID=A0ABN3EZR0_9ACTN